MIAGVNRRGRACALLVLGAWGLGGCGSRATNAGARDADGAVEAAPELSSDVREDALEAAPEALDVDAGDAAESTGCGAGVPAGDSETDFVVHELDVARRAQSEGAFSQRSSQGVPRRWPVYAPRSP